MFKVLARIFMFVAGVFILLDTGFPTVTESMQVDRHTSNVQQSSGSTGHLSDTSYNLQFIGGRVGSCSVGYSAYSKARDGDTVVVNSTKLFRKCIRISRDDEVLYVEKYWKLFACIFGFLLIAAAMGWVKSDDNGSYRID